MSAVPYQSTSRIFSTFYVQPSHRWFIPGCMFYRVATDPENLEKSGNLKETSESQGICLILVREFVTEFQKSGNFVVWNSFLAKLKILILKIFWGSMPPAQTPKSANGLELMIELNLGLEKSGFHIIWKVATLCFIMHCTICFKIWVPWSWKKAFSYQIIEQLKSIAYHSHQNFQSCVGFLILKSTLARFNRETKTVPFGNFWEQEEMK